MIGLAGKILISIHFAMLKRCKWKHLVSEAAIAAPPRCHRVVETSERSRGQMHEVSATSDICADRSLAFPDFFNPSCTKIRWIPPSSQLGTGPLRRWCAELVRWWIVLPPTVRTVRRFWSADCVVMMSTGVCVRRCVKLAAGKVPIAVSK